MALPIIVLVKTARSALKQWRDLPTEDRERLQGTAASVRTLAVELAGPNAGKLLGGEAQGATARGQPRDRDVVVRELKDALAVLVMVAGSGAAGSVAGRSRTAKVGGKLAKAGYRRLRGPDTMDTAPAETIAPVAPPPPPSDRWETLSSEIEAV